MPFPSPPWSLHGDAWLSLFRAAAPGEDTATWAMGLVHYAPGSTLEYSELVVARIRDLARREVTVRDIWVDSSVSRDAGRALWALPKELAEFTRGAGGLGPVGRHSWTVEVDGATVLGAEFLDTAAVALPAPARVRIAQPEPDGTQRQALVHGQARVVPCLSRWDLSPDGALAWLSGRPPLASFRVRDFRVTL